MGRGANTREQAPFSRGGPEVVNANVNYQCFSLISETASYATATPGAQQYENEYSRYSYCVAAQQEERVPSPGVDCRL